jgi:ABC-type uncharacterized transport system auxiliary subunit
MKVSLAVMSIGRRPAAAVIPVFILLLFWLGGCGSPRPIKYYEVNYPTKSFVAPDAIGATISVRIFETSPLYLDNKMVYGFDSPELGTYEYQRWVEPPAELLQMSLVRGLRASGRFKGVYTLRGDTNSPYILGGQLYDFKEVDGPTIVARLNYEVRLHDRKSGMNVWNYSYNRDEPAAEKTVNAFVQAMDKNLQRSVQEVQAGLEEYFKAHPPQ